MTSTCCILIACRTKFQVNGVKVGHNIQKNSIIDFNVNSWVAIAAYEQEIQYHQIHDLEAQFPT
jgi:hypothetical protein